MKPSPPSKSPLTPPPSAISGKASAQTPQLETLATEQERPLRYVSGVTGSIALIADVITIGLFATDVAKGNLTLNLGDVASRAILTIAVFAFGILLLSYARSSVKGFDRVAMGFAWIYVIIGTALLVAVSFLFIVRNNYILIEFLGLLNLVTLIVGLGAIMATMIGYTTRNFAIPFMVAALGQALLWLVTIYSGRNISFDARFVGNILLFVFGGMFIVYFMSNYWREHGVNRITVGIFVLVAFVSLGAYFASTKGEFLGFVVLLVVSTGIGLGVYFTEIKQNKK